LRTLTRRATMGAMPRLRIADLLAAAPVEPDAHLVPRG
jgi:hypothetical protein